MRGLFFESAIGLQLPPLRERGGDVSMRDPHTLSRLGSRRNAPTPHSTQKAHAALIEHELAAPSTPERCVATRRIR